MTQRYVWTLTDLQALGYQVQDGQATRASQGLPSPSPAPDPMERAHAAALLDAARTPYRSKTEARYADQLAWRVACGEVKRWYYEGLTLCLGVGCRYTPDFVVEYVTPGPLHLVEIKGAWIRDRALHKPKMAATRFPQFTFVLARWHHQTWTHTRIAAHA